MKNSANIISSFGTSPYVSAEFISSEYLDKFNIAVELIKNEYSSIVTGLWVLGEPSDEGGLVFILRTEFVADSESHAELIDKLYDIFDTSLFIDYNSEVIDDHGSVVISDQTVEHWIDNNLIFTIYDSERE